MAPSMGPSPETMLARPGRSAYATLTRRSVRFKRRWPPGTIMITLHKFGDEGSRCERKSVPRSYRLLGSQIQDDRREQERCWISACTCPVVEESVCIFLAKEVVFN